jgi:peptide chain release factor 2
LKRNKATIEPIDSLGRMLEDARVLAALAQEEEDPEAGAELEREAVVMDAGLRDVEFKAMLAGPDDHRNAFVSIHAGAGGTESCDWVQMLNRMYTRWMDTAGYKWEVVDLVAGEEAGIRQIALRVEGGFAYGYLKAEMGVHRLVRISPFDANKRRHTSFASVDCVPEIEDEEEEIDPNDLKIDTYRSSGAGGQHVNVTDSAVRILHIPTGTVVQCQNERSQHKNRRMAMSILKGKLHQQVVDQREEKLAKQWGEKKDIAFGSQIRSYVLQPYTMVKDHRTGIEIGDVQAVLDGKISPLIEGYLKKLMGGTTNGGT